ncbi:predicted protein [Phaeodactylum tricornutum CCAP 1055/1]|jgi:hypothetical protein|uniref:Uncharacterized protein n=2 Tax=Phaeodactylum tricornutum TaxID=2850 RepID=B7FYU4_PHATC|nr:predicted protein [Phaeodactylum tricornutum CCAP 1055/1]EEC48231.1 predicted protein [Phaeodactylum tricornutum CCAP 1055/1]|eukprot:XP_002180040.1 predicted protein [Phaeodactylum tricornutum CCAP 1055/1]
MKSTAIAVVLAISWSFSAAFTAPLRSNVGRTTGVRSAPTPPIPSVPLTQRRAIVQDLDVVALVAGQENYGLAVVCVGEALWSFLQAPSLDHAKVLVPAAVAALVLGLVSGPMVTSGDAATVGTGLWIATGVSLGLGASYVARMTAKYSPSPKEIAAFGLLVAVAGFFSFSQNLVVDGFVVLPSIPFPELPSLKLGQGDYIEFY